MKRLGILPSGPVSNFEAIADDVAAGQLKSVITVVIREFPLAIFNIHPALRPAFPDPNAQHPALGHGVKISGCTVHVVDECLDPGPIILQRAVLVLEEHPVETLSARLPVRQDKAYTEAIRVLPSGK